MHQQAQSKYRMQMYEHTSVSFLFGMPRRIPEKNEVKRKKFPTDFLKEKKFPKFPSKREVGGYYSGIPDIQKTKFQRHLK